MAFVPDSSVRWFRIGALALISFTAFESLAVGTVLPRAAAEFGATGEYSVAFGTAFAAMIAAIVVAGVWVDRFGVRGPLIAGSLLFAAGLATVALAPGMTVLAVGRAVQGFGSGMLGVVLYAMAGRVLPPEARPRLFAAFSAAWVLPSLVGPAIAGLAAGTVGWRWVFGGLAAPSLLALVATLRATVGLDESAYLRTDPVQARMLPAAVGGAAAIAVAQFAAPRGGAATALAGFAALVGALVIARVLPRGTLRAHPGIPRLVLLNGAIAGCFFAAEVYLPLYLVTVAGLTPFAAGSVLTGAAVTWATTAQLQGRLPGSGPARERLPAVGAVTVLVAVASVALVFALDAPWPAVFATWAVAGAGMGLIYPSLSVLVLALSPADRQGANSGALKLADATGTALAIAGAGAVFGLMLGSGHIGFAVTVAVPVGFGVLAAAVAAPSRLLIHDPAGPRAVSGPLMR
jgi:MFS family permease